MCFTLCKNKDTYNSHAYSSASKPDTIIKEIPKYKNGQYNVFYTAYSNAAIALGLDKIENGFDSLQLRIWYPERVQQHVVVIIRISKGWKATLYTYEEVYDIVNGIDSINNIKVRKLAPQSGWISFTKKLIGLNITTLVDSDNIPNYSGGGADGNSYCVEVATNDKYRFYTYGEIEGIDIQEARQMVRIMNLSNTEFSIEGDWL